MDNLTEILFDCIVVGSGPSGVMCAQTLVEGGAKVLLLDAGIKNNNIQLPSSQNFTEIRNSVKDQRNLFLGKDFEALKFDRTRAFAQITPQRSHILQDAAVWMPLRSENFVAVETLAYEGLGAAWGLGCYTFSGPEIKKAGLNPLQIKKAYQVVADRIGISYSQDDVQNYTAGELHSLQPSIEVDDNAKRILGKYEAKKKLINKKNVYLGKPALALLTEDKDNRSATGYQNMDFYSNSGNSAYRPSITLEKLKTYSNFIYRDGVFVISFHEEDGIVELKGINISTREDVVFRAKKLALAANVMSTARIVLRSFQKYGIKLHLLSNPYSYLVCIQRSMLGKIPSPKRTGTAQLSVFYDENGDHGEVPMASLYSYSSLMLFRILKELPLGYRNGLTLMKHLQSAIIIAGIHHPDHRSPQKFIQLQHSPGSVTGDTLNAYYALNKGEIKKKLRTEHVFKGVLKQVGCIPIKKVFPGNGASAHYAGTLPYSSTGELFTLSPKGLLSHTKNIFVADGSGLNFLPAKGPTLTLMANAHNTALNILQHE